MWFAVLRFGNRLVNTVSILIDTKVKTLVRLYVFLSELYFNLTKVTKNGLRAYAF